MRMPVSSPAKLPTMPSISIASIAEQAAELSIVQSKEIDTQEQLLEELRRQGLSATQATISRADME